MRGGQRRQLPDGHRVGGAAQPSDQGGGSGWSQPPFPRHIGGAFLLTLPRQLPGRGREDTGPRGAVELRRSRDDRGRLWRAEGKGLPGFPGLRPNQPTQRSVC